MANKVFAPQKIEHSDSSKEKIRKARKGYKFSEESKGKLRIIAADPDFKRKQSERAKKSWEKTREERLKKLRDPETQKNSSEMKRIRWADPDFKASTSAKISEGQRKAWTPERKAKHSIRMKEMHERKKRELAGELGIEPR